MKKLLALLLAVCVVMGCASALADHSVLPREGDLNETQAVDVMVERLCQRMNCGEDEIRGHWYYYAVYYPSSEWHVEAEAPAPQDGISSVDSFIDAKTGEFIEWNEYEEWDWEDDHLNVMPLIPRRDQMQPDEAVRRALELLEDALGSEHETNVFNDYILNASVSDEHFWYHVQIGDDPAGIFTWHVWLDADTGEVVWQTDPDRYKARSIYMYTGVSYQSVYQRRFEEKEAGWGPSYTWDYRQHAAFEDECSGKPYWPERLYSLPGENDVPYETARDAAIAYVEEHGDGSRNWTLLGSWFIDNENSWIDDMRQDGIPPKDNRYWEIGFEYDEGFPKRFGVEVDPATGEALGIIGW